MELMGEVLEETLLSDKPFWLRPSFLMGCIGFVVNLHTTTTKVKIDQTIRQLLTHMVPPCTASEKYNISVWG